MKTPPARRHVALTLLLVAAAVTLALSIDVMLRVVAWRDHLETAGMTVLLAFESMRVLLILGGALLAVLAVRHAGDEAAVARFGLGSLILALAAARALTGPLPGAWQERLAVTLLDRGAPQNLLAFIFVHAEWVAWLALPPLLLFARSYPRALTAADVLASGGSDRRGALRDVALAGTDVGDLGRRFTARLLASGALNGSRLWGIALLLAGAHAAARLALPGNALLPVTIAAAVLALVAATVLITLLRAGWSVSGADERSLLLWLRRGSAIAAGLVLLVVITELLPFGSLLGAAALYLAPLVLLVAALRGVPRAARVTASVSPRTR